MKKALRILIVAAENAALTGAKVGGLGDFVKYFSRTLGQKNCSSIVVIPAYGFLHKSPQVHLLETFSFSFAGQQEQANLFQVLEKSPNPVQNLILEHPRLSSLNIRGEYEIYHYDLDSEAYATDAAKYALFSAAIATGIKRGLFGHLDYIHLNDWHTSFLLILRQYHPDYQALQKISMVYTINNLSYQGVRPFSDHPSSLDSWYPGLNYDKQQLVDPRHKNCLNLMKAGIQLSEKVTTDSPAYAEEILYRGENLEQELLLAQEQNRLQGILLGCDYPDNRISPKMSYAEFIGLLKAEVTQWLENVPTLYFLHKLARDRLEKLSHLEAKPGIILTSIFRLVDQKLYLLKAKGERFRSGLVGILESLGNQGIYVLTGTGSQEYVDFLSQIALEFDNFVFLHGFASEKCVEAIYANGDLFILPSSYEPCGLSQMLALRDGQPCLVHNVGGLKDTVIDGLNGFVFAGSSLAEQVDNLVLTCQRAIATKFQQPEQWHQLITQAKESRFLWDDTVVKYLENVYI